MIRIIVEKRKLTKKPSSETNLGDWFKRKGEKGSKGGWIDCNAPDGKGGYKECAQGKRKKKPACRPTPSACKNWKKTKEGIEMNKEQLLQIIREEVEAVLSEDIIEEAEYKGRKVKLNKRLPGDVKKSKVYVKGCGKDKSRVTKINFGDKKMKIKKSNPKRRKSFRARHKCHTAKDKCTARYWSCKAWQNMKLILENWRRHLKEFLDDPISKEDVHDLADKLSIPWDDDADFMDWTAEVVGKSHLDDMTSEELLDVYAALEERGKENK